MDWRRWGRLVSVLALVACTDGHDPPVRFLLPRVRIVLAGPRGTDIAVQTRVERHEANRWFDLTWASTNGEEGRSSHSLDGTNEPTLQPIEPLRVHVADGLYRFRATVYGPGRQLRGTATVDLIVCGGAEGCGGP